MKLLILLPNNKHLQFKKYVIMISDIQVSFYSDYYSLSLIHARSFVTKSSPSIAFYLFELHISFLVSFST